MLYTLVQPSGAILSTFKNQPKCEIDHICITDYQKTSKKTKETNKQNVSNLF